MKKLIITLSLCVCTIFSNAQNAYEKQIHDITVELSKKIAESGKKRIAVADFKDLNGNITFLGSFIANEFNTTLPESGHGFEVIDRSRINFLIKENKLGDMTNPSEAIKLGKLASIDALVYGTFTPFSENVRLNLTILDLQRGVILRSLAGNITRTTDINNLLSGIVENNPTSPKTPELSNDCKQKNICTVCVTNQTSQDIITILHNNKRSNKEILINPKSTECWKEVPIKTGEDFEDMRWVVRREGRVIINAEVAVEACKTYNKIVNK